MQIIGWIFVFCFVAAFGFLIGRLQAYLFVLVFHVPVRKKIPAFLGSFLRSWPYFIGFFIPMLFIEEGKSHKLNSPEGAALLVGMLLLSCGIHIFLNRLEKLFLEEGWTSAAGARRSKIWAIGVSVLATVFMTSQFVRLNL
ncbi:hypothetical protein [Aliiroseovarius marinus]|uniref:hypothetical protein n=1 Tax=Aliiroseovarius marinus TaxID=2500159 RepID=UPI003D7D4B9C